VAPGGKIAHASDRIGDTRTVLSGYPYPDGRAARSFLSDTDASRSPVIRSLMNRLLYAPARDVLATPSVPFTDLTLRTEDGERLHAWWVPATAPAIANVLLCHGNGGNMGDRAFAADLLAGHGFGALCFDYRGYGRSSGRPSESGTLRDARAARAAIPDGPLIYLGESLGGAVALALAVEHPPDGLILQSAFTGVRDIARLHYPFIPRALVPDAYPSLRRIRDLHAPLLVMHGDEDRIVPVIYGEALYDAAREPKRIEIFRGAGHNDMIGPRWIEVLSEWARLTL
jgi:fermentation-respiration switch protein FrsA (DUF1100 family)